MTNAPRSLPYDAEAEKAVIGSLLLAPDTLSEVADLVSPESFYLPVAGDAFRAIRELANVGKDVDAHIVLEQLRRMGAADDGTLGWLIAAMNATPHSGHIRHYAESVAERYARRKLALIANKIGESSRDLSHPVADLVRWVGDGLEGLGDVNSSAWGEVALFDKTDLPEFPTEALPRALRDWVEAVSRATQTPPDLAALLGLATCSACIARRVQVEPRPGWREPTNLFVAIELPPGNRKSAVFSEATGPLRQLERQEAADSAATVAVAQSERRRMQNRLSALEKKPDAASAVEANDLAAQLAETPELFMPRRVIDESTPEFVGKALSEQGGRIAVMSCEGGLLDILGGMYSKSGAPNMNVFLMGHAGDDVVIDRMSRPSIQIEKAALTLAFAIQPSVIQQLASNQIFRGRGLVARFAFSSPKSWVGFREVAASPVPESVSAEYSRLVHRLGRLEGETVLGLTEDAEGDLRSWESIIEVMLAEDGELGSIVDWGSKLCGLTLRVAGILHCVEHGGPVGRIGQHTFQAAVELARYLIPHAEHVLRRLAADDAGKAVSDAEYLLKWITRHELRTFTRRDAHQHGKRRFPTADDLAPGLAELVARNFIRPVGSGATGPGRRPSPAYEVNPSVSSNPVKRSQYSQNPSDGPIDLNSGNCGSAFPQSENANLVATGGDF